MVNYLSPTKLVILVAKVEIGKETCYLIKIITSTNNGVLVLLNAGHISNIDGFI